MWANAQRDGRPAEYRWCPLFNATVWLTPTTRVPCSNAAKTPNPCISSGYEIFEVNGTIIGDLYRICQNYHVSDRLQAHQAAWIVTKRSIASDDHHYQFNSQRIIQLLKNICVERKGLIHQQYHCAGNNTSCIDDSHCL